MGRPSLRCSQPLLIGGLFARGRCLGMARGALLGVLAWLVMFSPATLAQAVAQTQGGNNGGVVGGGRVVQPFMPRQSIPTDSYFSAISMMRDGEFKDALKIYRQEGRSAIKSGVIAAWIDSICYHTMTGECFYEMGDLASALDHYNSALRIYANNYDYMNRVQFPAVIKPLSQNNIAAIPWGQGGRGARLGEFGNNFKMGMGQVNNNEAIQRGGVVQAPVFVSVRIDEIVRTTALAMRRRRDIMGPTCSHDALTGELISLLTRRPCPPNHWSEAWVDALLGIAYSASDKDLQAKNVLERAIIAGGQFDHPLTGMVLFELGRLANRAGDFAAADKFFMEAGLSAVQYSDVTLVEEAMRAGMSNHLMSNRPGVYPPLAAATTWARANKLRFLEASLLAMAAESAAVVGDSRTSLALLTNARGVMTRRAMSAGRVAARVNYAATVAFYQQGKIGDGDTALQQAMAFQTNGSLWMFHIGLVDQLYKKGSLSDRVALELFDVVLREPNAVDWAGDPLESLTVQMLPHHPAYEHWFEAAMARKKGGTEKAFEIADAVRRYRFLTTQEFGGRLLNLRWLLAGDPEMLSPTAKLQRQELLVRYPQLEQLVQQSQALAGEMRQVAVPTENGEAAKKYSIGLSQLSGLAQSQELLLRQIAVRREPCEIVFPPRRSVQEMQASLSERQGVLSFFTSGRNIHAFMMSHDKFGTWTLKSPAALQKQIVAMLHEMGNYDQNREVTLEELSRDKWKEPAKLVQSMIMEGSRNNLPNLFDELVIVPDGLLWYVPFECLQVGEDYETVPLITEMQIRYAPLTGLALDDPRPRRQGASTGVVVGRLFPRDDPSTARAAYEQVSQTLGNVFVVNGSVNAPTSQYAGLIDRLIVYADIAPASGGVYGWTPLPLDQKPNGNTLNDWFALPWGAPEQLVLPGFHTAAENALKGVRLDTAGNELFLNVTGLMATGSRTILLSRWRTGGQTAYDLVREFAQELPHTVAADAWQRSVFLLKEAELRPDSEPRLKKAAGSGPTSADHPFFWAGYMLVDSGTPAEAIARDPAADIIKKKPKKAVPAEEAAADEAAEEADADVEVVPVDKGEPEVKKKKPMAKAKK